MTKRSLVLLASVLLASGLGLLAFVHLRPPKTICDPVLGLPVLALMLAQGLALLAFAALRRDRVPGSAQVAVAAVWALASAASLAPWTSAGHLDALGAMDVAHAVGAGLALTLLVTGLGARAETKTLVSLGLSFVVVAAAGFGAASLVGGRATDRMILSWARLEAAATHLDAVPAGQLPPGEDVQLAAAAGALPAAARADLAEPDAWGRPLRYAFTDGTWRIWSLGADGKPGPGRAGPARRFAADLAISGNGPQSWPEQPCGETTDSGTTAPEPIDLRQQTRQPR